MTISCKTTLRRSIIKKLSPIAFALIILAFGIVNVSATTPLSISTITPSNAPIDNGQSITITGTWSGGTAPYNAVWYTGPDGTTCPQEAANVLATYNGLSTTSNSITVSPTTTNSYCLGITDSESPQVTQLSLNYTENAITSGFYEPSGIAISPSGTYAYAVNYGASNVVIINTATNTVTNTITDPLSSGFSGPAAVAFSPSGTYAYVTNGDGGSVVIIDTATNTVVNSITSGFSGGSRTAGIAFSPSGTYAYVTNFGSSNIVIVNTATNTVVNSITSSALNHPMGVAFSPDGSYAYIANNYDYNVLIVNTATNTVVNSINKGFTYPGAVAFSPSGTYAYIANGGYANVVIVNTATNTVTSRIIRGTGNPAGIAFSPSGTYAYVTNQGSNNVIIINQGVGAETTNLIYSNVTVYPALGIPQISPSNPVIDSGQSIILSFSWSGGTPDYTAKLYSSTTSTCNTGSTLVQTVSHLTSGSVSFGSVSPTSNTWYCTFVTDSSSTPETTNSISSEVIINPVLSAPTISPSNPTIDSGQSVTFSSTWSGGTPTYGISLYSSQTSTCNQQSTLVQQDIGITSGSAAFSTVNPSSDTYYCTFVTDNTPDSYSLSSSITSGFSVPDGVAFSPSGTYAYVTNYEGGSALKGNIIIINTASNTVVNAINSGAFTYPTSGIAFLTSGAYAYITNHWGDNVLIVNTASNTVTGSINSGFSTPNGAAVSHDGTYAYVANCNTVCDTGGPSNIVIVNTATNTVVNSITSGFNDPYGVSFSPSGTYAYVTNYGSNNVVIINTATNTVIASINSGFNHPAGVSFSPSGTYAYVANQGSNSIAIINTASNAVTASINSGLYGPTGVSFSPSGTYAYVTNVGHNPNNMIIINTGTATTNSINSEVVVNSALSIPTLSSSPSLPSTQAAGNTITFTSSWSGGTSTYTANYLIVNTITGNLVANMLFTGITGTTNSFAWVIPSNLAGNTLAANVFITDSATSPETTNSVESGTLTVISAYVPPSTPILSNCPSATKVESYQSVSCTATISGGTSPYTYNWLISNSGTNAIVGNTLYTGVTTTSDTVTVFIDASNFYQLQGEDKFNVTVTDSHPTTVNSVYSGNFYVTIHLSTPSIGPSSPTIDSGQSITLSSSWSGGFSPYTVEWYTGPSGNTCSQDSSNVLATYSSVSSTSNSITVTPTSTNSYCIGVTDSATTPVTELSSNDVVFMNTALGTGVS